MLVVIAALGACARPEAEPLRPLPDAAPGELVTLFTSDDVGRAVSNFRVLAAAPLPDGTVVVQWDPHATDGGDDREPFSDPQLSILGVDGTLRPLALPETADPAAADAAALLATDPEGRIYLWAGVGDQAGLVVRGPDLSWEARPSDLATANTGVPVAAVRADGGVYLSGDDGVYRLAPDGTQQRLVAVSGSTGSDDPGAPPIPAEQPPLPAQTVTLSAVWGLAVGSDGTVFISTRSEIVAVDAAGVLSLVTTYQDLQRELGIVSALDPPFLWSRLSLDADGSLLVSDSYQQLVADLEGPAVIARHATVVSNGLNATWGPHDDLLLRQLDPNELEAGPSLPDQLAEFGR